MYKIRDVYFTATKSNSFCQQTYHVLNSDSDPSHTVKWVVKYSQSMKCYFNDAFDSGTLKLGSPDTTSPPN